METGELRCLAIQIKNKNENKNCNLKIEMTIWKLETLGFEIRAVMTYTDAKQKPNKISIWKKNKHQLEDKDERYYSLRVLQLFYAHRAIKIIVITI
jgi:hypothetical protein